MTINTLTQSSIESNGFELKSYLENDNLNHIASPVLETILLEIGTISKSTTEELILSDLPFPVCLNSIWIDSNQSARNTPVFTIQDEQGNDIFSKRIRPRDTAQSLDSWVILPGWKLIVIADDFDLNRIVINCIKGNLIKRIQL